MKLLIIVVAIVLSIVGLLLAFKHNGSDTAKSASPSLSIKTISTDIARGGQMVDVRTPEEYASGHIDGAINLPLQDIQAGTSPSAGKDKPVYVYCRSGNRSGQATIILKDAGYKNIIDLGAITHVQSLGGVINT